MIYLLLWIAQNRKVNVIGLRRTTQVHYHQEHNGSLVDHLHFLSNELRFIKFNKPKCKWFYEF